MVDYLIVAGALFGIERYSMAAHLTTFTEFGQPAAFCKHSFKSVELTIVSYLHTATMKSQLSKHKCFRQNCAKLSPISPPALAIASTPAIPDAKPTSELLSTGTT